MERYEGVRDRGWPLIEGPLACRSRSLRGAARRPPLRPHGSHACWGSLSLARRVLSGLRSPRSHSRPGRGFRRVLPLLGACSWACPLRARTVAEALGRRFQAS